eukprot:3061618-Pyramimonas_sp.AAC.1
MLALGFVSFRQKCEDRVFELARGQARFEHLHHEVIKYLRRPRRGGPCSVWNLTWAWSGMSDLAEGPLKVLKSCNP